MDDGVDMYLRAEQLSDPATVHAQRTRQEIAASVRELAN
jgi:hypothetical protein